MNPNVELPGQTTDHVDVGGAKAANPSLLSRPPSRAFQGWSRRQGVMGEVSLHVRFDREGYRWMRFPWEATCDQAIAKIVSSNFMEATADLIL